MTTVATTTAMITSVRRGTTSVSGALGTGLGARSGGGVITGHPELRPSETALACCVLPSRTPAAPLEAEADVDAEADVEPDAERDVESEAGTAPDADDPLAAPFPWDAEDAEDAGEAGEAGETEDAGEAEAVVAAAAAPEA